MSEICLVERSASIPLIMQPNTKIFKILSMQREPWSIRSKVAERIKCTDKLIETKEKQ